LLRVLQEKEFYRVGGTKPINVDFRLLCATNRNLEQMVREGTFREDLYYRINIMSLKLPPLRERKEDIKLLAEYFIETSEKDIGKPISKIEPDVMELFIGYLWPGNIREFFGVLQSSAVVCQTDCITKNDIPNYITGTEHIKNEMFIDDSKYTEEKIETILHKTQQSPIVELTGWDAIYRNLVDVIESTVESGNVIYKDVLERIEKKMLDIVLEKTGRNLLWSSKLLGVSRNRLKRTLEKYGIERKIEWKKYEDNSGISIKTEHHN
jgi:transcriptional regulator with PAS, ATPase and Fis domain